MRAPLLLAVTLAFALVGCGKKTARNNSDTPDTAPPPPAPAPVQPAGQSGDGQPPANPGTPAAAGNTGGGSGNSGPAVVPGGGVGVVVNPNAALGGGGSGGAAQAVRKAAKRPATMNDLNQIRTFIEYASSADPNGRMPSPQQTYAALKKEAPKIAELVDEGVIVLNPARSREDVWAYEAAALTQGGFVVTNQGVERMDVPTLRGRLGLK